MIYVTTSDKLIHQRLEYRTNGISNASAEAIKHIFEIPDESVKKLHNVDGKDEIIQQLNAFYNN